MSKRQELEAYRRKFETAWDERNRYMKEAQRAMDIQVELSQRFVDLQSAARSVLPAEQYNDVMFRYFYKRGE